MVVGNLKKTYSIISDRMGRLSRKCWRNLYDRSRLKNDNFTIFSQNCIGGIMYHDLGVKFYSPTINMLFEPNDWIKFLERPKHYLNYRIEFKNDNECGYPRGVIDDVHVDFIHYKSRDEIIRLWNKRKERINWDNILVIACDKGMDEEYILRFNSLDRYRNKILFTGNEDIEGIYCDKFKDGADARLLNFANPLGKRFYEKYIDYVKWINGEQYYIKKNKL